MRQQVLLEGVVGLAPVVAVGTREVFAFVVDRFVRTQLSLRIKATRALPTTINANAAMCILPLEILRDDAHDNAREVFHFALFHILKTSLWKLRGDLIALSGGVIRAFSVFFFLRIGNIKVASGIGLVFGDQELSLRV